MSFAKGSSLPVHHVHCACGEPLARKTYWRHPKCPACSRKHWKGREAVRLRVLREQARRYRILMAIGPYGTWEELLAAIRVRQPRTRAQRYDLALDRRSA